VHARQSDNVVAPIEIDTLVPCAPEAAFAYFTRDIGRWWPLARYSCSQARAAGVALDGRVGGKVVERDVDGKEYLWGTVLEWNPGRRVVLSWHPGKPSDDALTLAVTFDAAGASTRVRLVHSGWERLGANAAEARDSYAGGWPTVMGVIFKGYCEAAA